MRRRSGTHPTDFSATPLENPEQRGAIHAQPLASSIT
jgi:hypothetical protein